VAPTNYVSLLTSCVKAKLCKILHFKPVILNLVQVYNLEFLVVHREFNKSLIILLRTKMEHALSSLTYAQNIVSTSCS